jgi:hypothetical protein
MQIAVVWMVMHGHRHYQVYCEECGRDLETGETIAPSSRPTGTWHADYEQVYVASAAVFIIGADCQ